MINKVMMGLAMLALSACAAIGPAGAVASALLGGPTPAPIQAVGQTVVLDGSKALAIAHITYESIGAAALAGRRNQLIPDATWAQVKAYDNIVYADLSKGDAAQGSAAKAVAAASALQALEQLKALAPGVFRNNP